MSLVRCMGGAVSAKIQPLNLLTKIWTKSNEYTSSVLENNGSYVKLTTTDVSTRYNAYSYAECIIDDISKYKRMNVNADVHTLKYMTSYLIIYNNDVVIKELSSSAGAYTVDDIWTIDDLDITDLTGSLKVVIKLGASLQDNGEKLGVGDYVNITKFELGDEDDDTLPKIIVNNNLDRFLYTMRNRNQILTGSMHFPFGVSPSGSDPIVCPSGSTIQYLNFVTERPFEVRINCNGNSNYYNHYVYIDDERVASSNRIASESFVYSSNKGGIVSLRLYNHSLSSGSVNDSVTVTLL